MHSRESSRVMWLYHLRCESSKAIGCFCFRAIKPGDWRNLTKSNGIHLKTMRQLVNNLLLVQLVTLLFIINLRIKSSIVQFSMSTACCHFKLYWLMYAYFIPSIHFILSNFSQGSFECFKDQSHLKQESLITSINLIF